MGIWTSVTIDANTRADKHISVLKIVQEHADGHDIVFCRKDGTGASGTFITHCIEFRIELDGDSALNFLEKLNKHLREVCDTHAMEIYGLMLY